MSGRPTDFAASVSMLLLMLLSAICFFGFGITGVFAHWAFIPALIFLGLFLLGFYRFTKV